MIFGPDRPFILHAGKSLDAYRIDVTLQPADSSQASSAVWTPVESRDSLACVSGAAAA